MEKITVTRALSELKTLSKRIDSSITQLKSIVSVKVGDRLAPPNQHITPADFEQAAKSDLQSYTDLLNRYISIKSAIQKSNHTTEVKVGDKTYTVEEALVMKSCIWFKESALVQLKESSTSAKMKFEDCIKKNQDYVDRMMAESGGSSDEKKKGSMVEARKDAEDYVEKRRKVEMVDPCEVDKLIKSLSSEIETFKCNIDYALSEVNSNTYIYIEI